MLAQDAVLDLGGLTTLPVSALPWGWPELAGGRGHLDQGGGGGLELHELAQRHAGSAAFCIVVPKNNGAGPVWRGVVSLRGQVDNPKHWMRVFLHAGSGV